jgi:hypothetical protein
VTRGIQCSVCPAHSACTVISWVQLWAGCTPPAGLLGVSPEVTLAYIYSLYMCARHPTYLHMPHSPWDQWWRFIFDNATRHGVGAAGQGFQTLRQLVDDFIHTFTHYGWRGSVGQLHACRRSRRAGFVRTTSNTSMTISIHTHTLLVPLGMSHVLSITARCFNHVHQLPYLPWPSQGHFLWGACSLGCVLC